jgi:hypothetical protein
MMEILRSSEIVMHDDVEVHALPTRVALTATVDRVEARPMTLAGFASDIILRDITMSSGVRVPDGLRLGQTGRLRALDLMHGDQITLAAQLDAYAEGKGRIGSGITDPAKFLATCPEGQRARVTFRLIRPSSVRRV